MYFSQMGFDNEAWGRMEAEAAEIRKQMAIKPRRVQQTLEKIRNFNLKNPIIVREITVFQSEPEAKQNDEIITNHWYGVYNSLFPDKHKKKKK